MKRTPKRTPCPGRKRRSKKKPRRSTTRRTTPPASTPPARVRATKLGEARSIVYKHADGNLYRHTFKAGTFLAQSDCGRYLIVGPVQVKRFID